MATNGKLKCHHCPVCLGFGCTGELPGLGGVYNNQNFQLNCSDWKELYNNSSSDISKIKITPEILRCGPVTGSVENIGYTNEEDFYYPYIKNAADSGFSICLGDGYPDFKLKFGIDAIKKLNIIYPKKKAAFFLKPYPDDILSERVKWILPYAEYIGIDIDSYNILTMRNLVHLEKKTVEQITKFRKLFNVPFVIKGVFTDEDIELVEKVKPDVVYISNHGGRIETRIGSTAKFLQQNASILKNYCTQIWIDGGIRCKQDIQTAVYFGADQVILARPLIHATFNENTSIYSSLTE